MRLHRLEIQAFGPFAGRETVDFDVLGSQGLFLLNGPTGAGKTSVLDAVAFALYGQVPGARKTAIKQLRSDHAAAGVGPEVVCEFSAGGRRLEVRRSPEWMRPAKRGTGTTREQASTQLREKVDGTWVVLSQRNDEAASEIQGLLGMSMEQFTKVILLAQGEFAAFLRASAKEREDLLEKLFGTEIYQNVELRLGADAKAAASQVAAGVAQLVALEQLARSQAADVLEDADELVDIAPQERISDMGENSEALENAELGEGAGLEAGTELEEDAEHAGMESTGAELFSWLGESLSAAVHIAAVSAAARQEQVSISAEAVVAAEQWNTRHSVRDAAMAEQSRLLLLAPEAAQWQHSLRRHHAAEVLASVVHAAAKSNAEGESAEKITRQTRTVFDNNVLASTLANSTAESMSQYIPQPAVSAPSESKRVPVADTLKTPTEVPLLEAVEQDLAGQLATVRAAMPAETSLVTVTATLRKREKAQISATAQVAAQLETQAVGKTRLEEIKRETTLLRQDAISVQQARDSHTGAKTAVDSIIAHSAQREVVVAAAAVDLSAREHFIAAKQGWLDAYELRLSLAAGELAATLVDGEPCQVCGSTVHPAPSDLAGSGAQALQQEKKAKALSLVAEKNAVESGTALAQAQQSLAVLAERGGDSTLEQAQSKVEEAKHVLETALACAARLLELGAEAEKVDLAVSSAQNALLIATSQVAALEAERTALAKEISVLEAGLSAGRAGFSSLAKRQEALVQAQSATKALLAALRHQESAATAQLAATLALDEALAASDFQNAPDVLAALLSKPMQLTLQEQIAAFERAGTLNTAQRALPEVAAAEVEAEQGLTAPGPGELAELRVQALRRSEESGAAAVRWGLAVKAQDQVAESEVAFGELELAVAPLRDRADLLAGLADAVRGGGDNQLKMTLTSYVLAARLEQVAMAASTRLSTMSGSRYTLAHTDAKAGGNRKSGLGLEVVDEWTQRSRDTSTLSGGESFMASLSLALGLADVVQQESGGLDIETLFVDEGFGSLDEDSLEQVMDALEGLRDGGRVVGLVSHVAEMKTRISVHLQVTKSRDGSTLSVGQF